MKMPQIVLGNTAYARGYHAPQGTENPFDYSNVEEYEDFARGQWDAYRESCGIRVISERERENYIE